MPSVIIQGKQDIQNRDNCKNQCEYPLSFQSAFRTLGPHVSLQQVRRDSFENGGLTKPNITEPATLHRARIRTFLLSKNRTPSTESKIN
ncbi:hypothetical protein FGO68_gene14331 [Halteria grandinella]|uniref:Uncharacterized protein n=1 Tax=Halteria grandinella TaxID=5974 RepID=A0A8J8SYR7_HALGN|nr:hypothetical protein FGO68_gene14331 [Halteria grandinella]